jgi:cobalt-zinc-cadmium efflux system outer membrane protein
MKKTIVLICLILIQLKPSFAQTDINFKHVNLKFKDYIGLVKNHNLQYAAEKLNINISEAAVEAAKIFNDPYISVDVTRARENSLTTGYELSSELVKPIDLGGERNARIDLTRSERGLTVALVDDYFRNLRAEATLYYLEAMKHEQLFMVRLNSYETMKKLAEADSIRFKLGSIMEIDAIQSKLETGILLNELIHATAEWKNSLSDLSILTSITKKDTLFLPSGRLNKVDRNFILDDLITEAQKNRSDLQAALLNKEVAQKALRLTKKTRNTDIDLKIGLSHNYLNDEGSPSSSGITAGIAMPLKFSNLYRGEIRMAEIRVQQAEELYYHADLLIKNEVIQAWEYYMDYCRQVANFDNGLLRSAENVRKGKVYSYQRGETSLLEVLNAQRTYNEIQTRYYETLFYQAAALVELEKAAGIWDIDF